jgi:hypothetical protein
VYANKIEGDTMSLKPFYFDVEIKGVALIYAENADKALANLVVSGAAVGGNKMSKMKLEIISKARNNITSK